ncbi:MAG TPA: response regulator transcription factor [Burkholderiales bacterium]|nr:response regulator transcription factor [Burkholderiales bacterium]
MNANKAGSAPIRILLVDDHAIVREGYRALLEKQPRMLVVGEAQDGNEAYERSQATSPDVIIMDLSMPGQGGLEAIARIFQRFRNAKILVFSMHQNPTFAIQATRAGARGYVSKSSSPDVLVRAVYEVHEGRHVLSPDIAQAIAMAKLGGEHGPLDELTVREFEILRMLVEARSTDDIAQALHISPKTVSNCHYQIKRKLGVATDIELVRLALRLNVVDLLELSSPASQI